MILPFGLHWLLFVNLILQEWISLLPASYFTLFYTKRMLNLFKFFFFFFDHSNTRP